MRSSRPRKPKTARYDNSRKDEQQDLVKALEDDEPKPFPPAYIDEEYIEDGDDDHCGVCGFVLTGLGECLNCDYGDDEQ